MRLELNDTQAEELHRLVDHAYRDLRYEIADSDVSTFKDALRARGAVVAEILDMLGGPIEPG